MSDDDEFLGWLDTEYTEAERELLSGDARARAAIWSRTDPVSVLGAWRNGLGRAGVVEAFEEIARSFTDCREFAFDLIAHDVIGDMAYTVGYERFTTSIDGSPRTLTLRVTQVYRREDGAWRVAHRHADST
ncbi:DUF4440 domain-containing protein [Agromyces sp. MMS17-SY077]|uniref:DUF4440 domain-containing protein n=2 Tax=Agromyces seonyuensis TaxID=2662446 RepID=A0A6I4NTN5_9MICO|nr:DUF4440 domain-containing protein [Agromyces seonyuensis]